MMLADAKTIDAGLFGNHRLFDDLEFRVLRDRLFATLTTPEPEADEGFELAAERLEGADVSRWLERHATGPVGVHVVGAWRAGRGDATGIAVAGAQPVPDSKAASVLTILMPSASTA